MAPADYVVYLRAEKGIIPTINENRTILPEKHYFRGCVFRQ